MSLMNGTGYGDSRPLLALHHRGRAGRRPGSGDAHTPPRWLLMLAVACVLLLAGTMLVGTHRTVADDVGRPPSQLVRPNLRGSSSIDRGGGDVASLDAAAASTATAAPAAGDDAADVGIELQPAIADTSSGVGGGGERASEDGDAAAAGAAAGAAAAAGGDDGAVDDNDDATAAAADELYAKGGGGILLGPLDGGAAAPCPAGVAPRAASGPSVALAIIAGAGSAARLEGTVKSLLARMASASDDVRAAFHAYVIVDGLDPAVKRVAVTFATQTAGAVRVIHRASASAVAAPGAGERCSTDAGRPSLPLLALRALVECLKYPSLLLLGDDARLAPDALAYFAHAAWLAEADPTLACVAGAGGLAVASGGSGGGNRTSSSSTPPAQATADPALLLRSDAMPSPRRGWLVPRRVGLDLLAAWRAAAEAAAARKTSDDSSSAAPSPFADSAAGWAAFLASEPARRGRQCVAPDLPRVRRAPKQPRGAADGDGDVDADGVAWPPAPPSPLELARRAAGNETADGASSKGKAAVAWEDSDLSWLLEPGYGRLMVQRLKAARLVAPSEAAAARAGARPRRVRYESRDDYAAAMRALGLPDAVDSSAGDGGDYCFTLPPGGGGSGDNKRECLGFAPPLAYRGVVPTYNQRGARVFIVPAAYDALLAAASEGKQDNKKAAKEEESAAADETWLIDAIGDEDQDAALAAAADHATTSSGGGGGTSPDDNTSSSNSRSSSQDSAGEGNEAAAVATEEAAAPVEDDGE